MSTAPTRRLFTEDEYLRIEREAEERSFYLDGVLYAMPSESWDHAGICTNLVGSLGVQLKGTPCRVRCIRTKVRSGPTNQLHGDAKSAMYAYPDVLVVCGDVEFHDDHRHVIINPTAVFEVLSVVSEEFDRGEKFTRFKKWNHSLRDYILISQDRPRVEHHRRQPDGQWLMKEYIGLDAVIDIESIRCTLKLADVYDRVRFPVE